MKIKRLAVGLDMTKMDETIIEFANFQAKRHEIKEIYFIHVIRNIKFPEEVKLEFPHLEEKAIEEKETLMREKVETNLDPNIKANCIFIVKTGKIARNILKVLDANNIDLIIIGKSLQSKERGLLAQKLARLASCQLLIVPDGCKPQANRILVPMNHSPNDKDALNHAIDIAKRSGATAEIICQVIYSVPTGYRYTGKSYEEFAEIMKSHADKKFRKMLATMSIDENVNVSTVFTLDKNDDAIDIVYKEALKTSPDYIVISAKGKSSATALFLSSVAEKLIQIDTKFPIRIVRSRGDNEGIMDLLLKI